MINKVNVEVNIKISKILLIVLYNSGTIFAVAASRK